MPLAFGRPEDWLGREIELTGDERTLAAYAELMTRNLGRTIRYRQVTFEAVRGQSEDFAKMYAYPDVSW